MRGALCTGLCTGLCIAVMVATAVGALAARPLQISEAQRQKLVSDAKSLPAKFREQWSDRLAQQKANMSFTAASWNKTINSQAAVREAVKELLKIEAEHENGLVLLMNGIVLEYANLLNFYASLLEGRPKDPMNSTEITATRERQLALWSGQHFALDQGSQAQFQKALLAHTQAAEKSSNKQAAERTRQDVLQVGAALQATMIQQMIENVGLLQAQFNEIRELGVQAVVHSLG